jgi:hypothetical protein
VKYLEHLSRPGGVAQRLWPPKDGERPETLEAVFSREARLMLNPFTGKAFSGLDEWGNDWTELAEADHLAMLWAVATGHRNLPPVIDARRLTDDLFEKKRPAYLREIIEDFGEARRRDPQLASVSRYFTQGTAAGLAAAQPPPRRTEEDYLNLLLGAAQASRNSAAGDVRLGETVIRSFRTAAGEVALRGTIVLSSSGTVAGNLSGTAYVPRGVTISTVAGSNRLDVYEKSYEDLARRAGLA